MFRGSIFVVSITILAWLAPITSLYAAGTSLGETDATAILNGRGLSGGATESTTTDAQPRIPSDTPAAVTATLDPVATATVTTSPATPGATTPVAPGSVTAAPDAAGATATMAPVIARPPVSGPATPAAGKHAAAPSDNRVVLNADRVSYDSDLDTATARGHVQLAQGTQVLTADVVSYNQDTDQVTASGNVVLRDNGGNIFFGNYLELRDKMSNGFINQVKGILLGDVRIVGNTATRKDDRYMEISRGVYSPCELCKDDPSKPPIWQLKALQVEHDADEQNLYYYDTTLEFDGVPVLWSPYFSNADPTVKQRSGFLSPEAGDTTLLGATIRSYYYWGISPQEDATIETTYASAQGPLLGGEYRNRFDYGKLILSGSLAEGDNQYGPTKNDTDPDKTVRGHIFGLGIYDLDDNWRTGFNIARTTDDTFLREYGYSDQDVLDNRLYVEGFFDRDYAVANVYDAQDLRPGVVGTQPLAAPYSSYQAFGGQGETLGGRWDFNTGFLGLLRPGAENLGNLAFQSSSYTTLPVNPIATPQSGSTIKSGQQDVARYSAEAGWQRTFIGAGLSNEVDGHVFLDAYGTNNQPNLPGSPVDTDTGGDFSGRYLPQIHDITSYPWVAPDDDGHWLVQPMGSFTFAPQGLANNNKIPNEDSLDLELDTTNLFAANRFPGIDRIETGAHVAYGVKTGYFWDSGGYATALVGQSRRLSGPDIFPEGSGLEKVASDYVGGVDIYPGKYVNFSYQTRLDPDTLSSQLQQVNFSVAPDPAVKDSYGLNYTFLSSIPTIAAGENRNNLTPFFQQQLTKFWSFTGSAVVQLGSASRLQEIYTTTQYQDDCFTFQVQASRNLTNSVGGLSGTSIFFRIGLKTLGFFQSPNIAGALSGLVPTSTTSTVVQ